MFSFGYNSNDVLVINGFLIKYEGTVLSTEKMPVATFSMLTLNSNRMPFWSYVVAMISYWP